MDKIFIILLLIILIYLYYENYKNKKNRESLKHIIHVNGIRGKSTVVKLIHSGLRADGISVFCKTTGTIPITIDSDNNIKKIKRRSSPNIKEQIKVLETASKNSEVLIIECMAVDPELQYISQHKILKGDISVITNVRLDHTEEMGSTLDDIAMSLSNTIPKNGILVTGEKSKINIFRDTAKGLNSEIVYAAPRDDLSYINFPDNVSIALEVCKLLGVEEKIAIKGMKKYVRDPFELKLYDLGNEKIFINGLSINDPDSTELVFNDILSKHDFNNYDLVLLINNRPDRGYRASHMVDLAYKLNPSSILLMGSNKWSLKYSLKDFNVEIINNISRLDFHKYKSNTLIYGVGNIANDGDKIIEYLEREYREYV